MHELYDKWNGLIPILAGIYGLLLAYRVVPRKPKDPEKMELWHRKFGKMIKILSPLLIIFGILELLGVIG
jgi:hypothetical protein